MKKTLKRVYIFIMCLILSFSSVLGSIGPIPAQAANYYHFSKQGAWGGKDVVIDILGRHGPFGLFQIHTSTGVGRVFCGHSTGRGHAQHASGYSPYDANTNSGSNDLYSLTEIYAANWKSKSGAAYGNNGPKIAKALIWYYDKLGGNGSTLQIATAQTWIWAYSRDVNVNTAISQLKASLKSKGIINSSGEASIDRWVAQIRSISRLYGKVQIYNCCYCPRGESLGPHQPYYKWIPATPDVAYVNKTDSLYETEGKTLEIQKTNRGGTEGVNGATFSVIIPGFGTRTLTTGNVGGTNGIATTTISRSYSVGPLTSASYYYVKNYAHLSDAQQAQVTRNGWYASKALAALKAQDDLNTRLANAMTAAKNTRYTWTVRETSPGSKHILGSRTTWNLTESGYISLQVENPPKYGSIKVTKNPANNNYLAGSTMAGAVYELYTANTGPYYFNDGHAIKKKDQKVATLTIGSNNTAQVNDIPVGDYYLKETKAPSCGQFILNTTNVNVSVSGSGTAQNVGTKNVTTTDTPDHVTLYFNKVIAYSDGTYSPETVCSFNLKGVKNLATGSPYNKTVTADSNGYIEFTGVPYGQYVLTQVTKKGGTKRIGPFTINVTKNSQRDLGKLLGKNIGGKYALVNDLITKITIHKELTKTDQEHYINGKYRPRENKPEAGKMFAAYKESVYNTLTEEQRRDLVVARNQADDIITTDRNGNATTKDLDQDYYYLVQLTGTEGYAFMDDIRANLLDPPDDEEPTYSVNNPSTSHNLSIQKYTKERDRRGTPIDGTEVPEEGAEFYVLDSALVDQADLDEYTEMLPELEEEEDRLAFVQEHNDAVIGKLTTDEQGKAFVEFPINWAGDFVIIQTKGKADYEISPPVYSTDSQVQNHTDGYAVFYNTDIINNHEFYYAMGKIIKTKQINAEGETAPEDNAVFKIHREDLIEGEEEWFSYEDLEGHKIDTFTTDSNGVIYIPYLTQGAYTLVQQSGSKIHELLDEEDAYFTVGTTECTIKKHVFKKLFNNGYDLSILKPEQLEMIESLTMKLENPLSPVTLKVKKSSTYTKKALNDAYFKVIKPGNDEQEEQVVATLITGEDGNATGETATKLEAGTYILEEAVVPEGYASFEKYQAISTEKTSGEPVERKAEIVIDAYHATYDEATRQVIYTVTDSDSEELKQLYEDKNLNFKEAQVMGRIAVDKTGSVTTDLSTSGFNQETKKIKNSTYELYAEEDIKNDAGEIIFHKYDAATNPDPISTVVTDNENNMYFLREVTEENVPYEMIDGKKMTDRFYLGKYFVKEKEEPDGYRLDAEVKHIVLTSDASAADVNDLFSLKDDSEADGNGRMIKKSYYLLPGEQLNPLIKNAKKIIFTYTAAQGATVDVSAAKDNSIVMWHDSSDTYYISTQRTNQPVCFNLNCDKMFYKCARLQSILFDNINTDYMTSCVSMFEGCPLLTNLDMMNVTTFDLEDSSYMFAQDKSLTTIYMGNEDQPSHKILKSVGPISANPNQIFLYYNPNESGEDEDMKFVTDNFDFSVEFPYYYISGTTLTNDTMGSDFANLEGFEDIVTGFEPAYPYFDDPNVKEGEREVKITYNQAQLQSVIENSDILEDLNAVSEESRAVLGQPAWTAASLAAKINQLTGGVIKTKVKIINPDLDLSKTDEDPESVAKSDEPLKYFVISLLKFNENDTNRETPLEGAEFKITAATDLYSKASTDTLIASEGDEITSLFSLGAEGNDDSNAAIEIPCDVQAGDPNAPYLYEIEEITAPVGYKKSDVVVYVPNIDMSQDLTDAQFEQLIIDANPGLAYTPGSGPDNREVVFRGELAKETSGNGQEIKTYNISFMYSDKPLPTITKDWSDVPEAERPDELVIRAVPKSNPSATPYEFHLTEDENWTTYWEDMPTNDVTDYNFTEVIPDDAEWRLGTYTLIPSTDTLTPNVVSFVNEPDNPVDTYITTSVKKVWDDKKNLDSIRPDKIYVNLMRDGVPFDEYQKVELNAANNWTYSIKESDGEILPRFHRENGRDIEYQYTWEEDASNAYLTGDPTTGYEVEVFSKKKELTGHGDFTASVDYTLENHHEVVTESSVKKNWDDMNNHYETRPSSLEMALYNGNQIVNNFTAMFTNPDTGEITTQEVTDGKVTLSDENGWEAVAKGLEKFDSSDHLIKYTWKEVSAPEGYNTPVESTAISTAHNVTVHLIDRSGASDRNIKTINEVLASNTDSIQDVVNKAVKSEEGSVTWNDTKYPAYSYISSLQIAGTDYKVLSPPSNSRKNNPENKGWVWSTEAKARNASFTDKAMDENKINSSTDLYLYYYGTAGRSGKLTVRLVDQRDMNTIVEIPDLTVQYNDTLKECLDKALKDYAVGWVDMDHNGTKYEFLKSITVEKEKYDTDRLPESSEYPYTSSGWYWNFSGDTSDKPMIAFRHQTIQANNTLYLFYNAE